MLSIQSKTVAFPSHEFQSLLNGETNILATLPVNSVIKKTYLKVDQPSSSAEVVSVGLLSARLTDSKYLLDTVSVDRVGLSETKAENQFICDFENPLSLTITGQPNSFGGVLIVELLELDMSALPNQQQSQPSVGPLPSMPFQPQPSEMPPFNSDSSFSPPLVPPSFPPTGGQEPCPFGINCTEPNHIH